MSTLPELMTAPQVADLVGVSVHTVKKWRARGAGPPFQRLTSRAVVYVRSDVERWARDEFKRHGNLGKRAKPRGDA